MLITFVIILAFYLAFNLGANDVANAMGTSVGSKAITLKQALIVAGVLEFAGAALFGREVTETLSTNVANPELFANSPQSLITGMISVLIACGLWLQIATARGLPVSSSHAVVGAIAGFSGVALGGKAIAWSSIGTITVGWVLTPVISGIIAALFYSQIQRWILQQPNQLTQLNEWIPWLSTALIGAFGVIVLPTLTQPITELLGDKLGIQIPQHDISLLIGGLVVFGLTVSGWQQLKVTESENNLEKPAIENPIERLFARYQVLSACFVAFAHGSNDVGNAIAPLATIIYTIKNHAVPTAGIEIPLWIMLIGAMGIVTGLAILGKKVIATIGESIITLQPSSGFCAELATATTILLASRFGLPVSTSHALVGGVVGIGLVKDFKSIQFSTLKGIAAAWVITLPASAGLSAVIFSLIRWIGF
ncbi:inorganic phosphate transporter [Calothrix sp. PCC 6303]|uniref:inorganic phosphate transporter n=1 Tax=Calothrix sp. PCC 6303 TaxID=1170562 RepID=UPI0002A0432D|nr:inorganic phosphate transporter [Calothrix sp. PCC 6303]AFZ03137.1 phosphate transporter [Calothrix sp. PCC 6303]